MKLSDERIGNLMLQFHPNGERKWAHLLCRAIESEAHKLGQADMRERAANEATGDTASIIRALPIEEPSE